MIFPFCSWAVLFCCIWTVRCAAEEKFPTVTIKNGELMGKFLQSRGGNTYSTFLGIPYAKPPQRFKLAKPIDNWNEIRNATEYGEICPQKAMFSNKIVGSEDCLFLNIFSPQLDGNYPVMVYIHGGAFDSGSSNLYQAKYFMDEKIVLVTINYRLGPLGFIDTGDGEVEANLGLKDQVLALQFVQQNIKAFGGDSSKVTIFGESAGAASVHHHVLSPASKGLFNKAIAQSGSALGWGIQPQPEKTAFRLGKVLGCFPENTVQISTGLLDCLKKQTVEDILKHTISNGTALPVISFLPTVEIPGKGEQTFVADAPINILKSGNYNKVPIVFTACSEEGILLSALVLRRNLIDLNNDSITTFPMAFRYKDVGYFPYEENWMSSQIKNFYFGTNQIDNTTFGNLTDLFSDRFFFHPIENSIELHSKYSSENAKVYNALFTYRGKNSFASLLGFKDVVGVGHADELQYLFSGLFLPLNSEDENISKEFVRLWASFATNGNNLSFNNVSWDATEPSKLKEHGMPWLSLDVQPKILQGPFKERMDFWENLISGARPEDLMKLGNIIK